MLQAATHPFTVITEQKQWNAIKESNGFIYGLLIQSPQLTSLGPDLEATKKATYPTKLETAFRMMNKYF